MVFVLLEFLGVADDDRINYTRVVSSSTASLQLVKTLLFLLSTLPRAEYIRIPVPVLPDDIREEFQLDQYIYNGFVLFEVTKGMYGLPQAGYLAQKELIDYLAGFDYYPSNTDPCLFRHKTNGVAFTLVVDDFLIKYKERDAAMHLLTYLQARYPLKFDWSPSQYFGIDIAFDKLRRTVKLSIPGYIPKMLRRLDPDGVDLSTTPCIYVPPIKGIRTPQMVE